MRLAGGSNVTKNRWRTRLHSFTNFNGDGVAGCGSRGEERCAKNGSEKKNRRRSFLKFVNE